MAKRQKTKAFAFKGFDNRHYRLTDQYVSAVDSLFARATNEISLAATNGVSISPDKPFSFEDYPKTKVQVQKIINGLANNITAVVETGSRKQWLYACQKNDDFVASIIDTTKLSKARLSKMQDRNLDAFQTFQQRKVDGMNLSQRVWKYVGQYKEQIELGLDVGLGDGRSAQQLARDLRQNLQDPDRLFRRVRDKHGSLQLSKAAKAYHPGQGVYRSSVKNAQRLTRSEINMAYRESDWLRWQQLDFVIGFEIHRSNHEPQFKCNLCQRLIGRYPKTFKFKGWHPQCMCYATAILMDEDDFDAQELSDLKGALYGKSYKKLVPNNTVIDFPQGFKDWVAENTQKQSNWASTPYFIRDNFVNGNLADGLKYDVPKVPIKPVKTEQQKMDIQARWNTRVTSRMYNDQLQGIKAKYGEDNNAITNLISKINNEIQSGASISKVDSLMDKLNHKMQVKAAWDERVEINKLETLLVDVKALKTQFDMPTIQTVFNAVETKLASWESLSLEQQVKKLNFEIEWVAKNKKYDTWQAAQEAYKKRLVLVEYLIDKESIKINITHALDFTKTTKSANVKMLAMELNTLLDKNAPIDQLKQKASLLNNAVAKLETAKAARDAKKLFGDMKPVDWSDESNYTKARKDDAMWAKTPKEADGRVRSVLETVWQNSTAHEKLSAYRYTAGSSYINEPLRGQYYSGQYVGKYDSKKDIDALSSIVNKSSYKFDMWIQRGVDANGFRGLFGFDVESIGTKNLQSIHGKAGIEKAFSSCALSKGGGFSNKKIIYNIYCPRGTKMLYAEPYSAFGNGQGKSWDGKTQQSHFGYEIEMILQKNTKFRITKAEYSNGKYYIDMEVIGQ